jgi:proteic killer suppression protein
VIASYRYKGLKELLETGTTIRITPALRRRCHDILEIMHSAIALKDMNLPGHNLHQLRGNPVRHSIHVNGPWCITFEWNAPAASRVDLEQYH